MPGEGRGGSTLPPASTSTRPLPVPKLRLSVCVPFMVGTHGSSPPRLGSEEKQRAGANFGVTAVGDGLAVSSASSVGVVLSYSGKKLRPQDR